MPVEQAATVGGGAVFIMILLEALKRALQWNEASVTRWAPLTAILMGVVFMEIVAGALGNTSNLMLVGAALNGIIAGASSCGLYDVLGKSTIERLVGPMPTGGGG